MGIFGIELIAENFELSLLTVKGFLRWVVEGERAPSRKIVVLLQTRMGGRKKRNFNLRLPITDSRFCEKQIRNRFVRFSGHRLPYIHVPRVTRAFERASFGGSGGKRPLTFPNGSTFLQSNQRKKKASAETALPKSVKTSMEPFLFSSSHAREWVQG